MIGRHAGKKMRHHFDVLNWMAEAHPARVAVFGGKDVIEVIGLPDDVRNCVRQRVEQFGQDIVLAPTHVLEPEVPIENIKAFFTACDEISFGK